MGRMLHRVELAVTFIIYFLYTVSLPWFCVTRIDIEGTTKP